MEVIHASQKNEKYLLAIYRLLEIGMSRVSTSDIATQMGISQSTVVSKMKSIALDNNNGYPIISYQKHYGIQLTHEGIKIAAFIMRKFRIIENILLELGLSWKEIHLAMADMTIPQNILDKLEMKIPDEFLYKCPHGSIIPSIQHLDIIKPSYPLTSIPDNNYVGSYRVLEHTVMIDNEESYIWDFSDIMRDISKIQKPCQLNIDEDGAMILSSVNDKIVIPKSCAPFVYVYDTSSSNINIPKASSIKLNPSGYSIQKIVSDHTERELSDIISQAKEKPGIYTFNYNLEFTSWNEEMENILDLKKENVIGNNLIDLFPSFIRDSQIKPVIEVFTGKIGIIDEMFYKNLSFKSYIYPQKNMSGTIIGGTVVIREVKTMKKID